jgi:uncharacterized repeat protein (TIGR01451 family)
LAAGNSYPPVVATVDVDANAGSPQVNQAIVSGGGSAAATASDSTMVRAVSPPVLLISKSHVGNFTQGQQGATYTITVSNAGGAGPTSGTVMVSDTPSSGLALVSLSGVGWGCSGDSCSRGDSLAGGGSYPPLVASVDVAADASSPQVQQAIVSGGGSAPASASDSTTIISLTPVLSIAKSHSGNFTQGEQGAAYTITVSNGGTGPTSGVVTLNESAPGGMTLQSMSGTGWTCASLPTCTRSDPLAAGGSYPPVGVTVNVAGNAGSPLVNQAIVSGGGSASATAGDPTIVNVSATGQLGYLQEVVGSLALPADLATELGQKLVQTSRALVRGDVPQALQKLDEFASAVGRETRKNNPDISADDAATLITSASNIEIALGATPRPVPTTVLAGDFNGDGQTGIAEFSASTGTWTVGLAKGSKLQFSTWATWSPAVTWVDLRVGDFNGDGKADIAGRVLSTGQWWVGLSNGHGFTTTLWTTWNPAVTWVDVQVGDFNGDGKADIAGRVSSSGQWWIGDSTGADFTNTLWATWNPAVTWVDVHVGDFNGDGKADIAGRVLSTGQWWVGLSNGSGLTSTLWATWSPAVTWVDVQVGDFNGDGEADIAGRVLSTGQWWVGLSNGSGLTSTLWATWSPAVTWVDVQVGDFNGDGRTDIAGLTAPSETWWVGASSGTVFLTSLWSGP